MSSKGPPRLKPGRRTLNLVHQCGGGGNPSALRTEEYIEEGDRPADREENLVHTRTPEHPPRWKATNSPKSGRTNPAATRWLDKRYRRKSAAGKSRVPGEQAFFFESGTVLVPPTPHTGVFALVGLRRANILYLTLSIYPCGIDPVRGSPSAASIFISFVINLLQIRESVVQIRAQRFGERKSSLTAHSARPVPQGHGGISESTVTNLKIPPRNPLPPYNQPKLISFGRNNWRATKARLTAPPRCGGLRRGAFPFGSPDTGAARDFRVSACTGSRSGTLRSYEPPSRPAAASFTAMCQRSRLASTIRRGADEFTATGVT
jgi:hypothetical protein